MGDYPPHGPGPEYFPEQGGPMAHRKTYTVALEKKLGVPPLGLDDGVGNVGGGFGGDVGVHLEEG